jgi:hypothetical protein
MFQTKAYKTRARIREEFFPNDEAWTCEKDKDVGFFMAPRTLPLVVSLLNSKALTGDTDITAVYLELWSRHQDNGIVEIANEQDHAYAAGYEGSRALRTWQERMKKLEQIGAVKTASIGNRKYAYILLVHPTALAQRLKDDGKISENWWRTYRMRQIAVGELTHDERFGSQSRVVPIRSVKTKP